MTPHDAAALIQAANLGTRPAVWADLGSGDGTFTLALAALLPAGSTIHAIDLDATALSRIPTTHAGTAIVTHVHDFTQPGWPTGRLDGVVLANSLHHVRDQAGFLQLCAAEAGSLKRYLVVEYDTDAANRWVPYPISRRRLATVFTEAGYPSIQWLGTRPSLYRRAALYAALVHRSDFSNPGR